jgi:membrane peptidoglycan carboxypeptidase
MGVKVPLAQKVPSWILGVSDSNPLEIAQAYATFAARGLHCDPRPVTQVLDSSGQVLKDFSTQCEQVMPGATADAVNDILRGVMEPGGFGSSLAIDKPSAGKTGTNQNNMSVWFAGYTPTLSAAAMVAGANEFGEWVSLNGQVVGGSPIYEAFGSTVAGPIWGEAMAAASPKLAYEDFQAPPGDEIAGVQSVEAATAALQAAGFVVADGGQVNSETGAGLVAYTSPEGGAQLSSGDTVTLYTSTGYVPPPSGNGNGGGRGRGNGDGDGDD